MDGVAIIPVQHLQLTIKEFDLSLSVSCHQQAVSTKHEIRQTFGRLAAHFAVVVTTVTGES